MGLDESEIPKWQRHARRLGHPLRSNSGTIVRAVEEEPVTPEAPADANMELFPDGGGEKGEEE